MTRAELKRTPLYQKHVDLGARIVPFAGWQMPVQYAGVIKEHQAVRQAAGLFDVGHMGELLLSGPSAVALVDRMVTNDIASLDPGKAAYTVCCNERGTILDDLIVYLRGPELVLVVCNASNRDKISALFSAAAKGVCEFRDATEETSLLALQGPRAMAILGDAGADPRLLDLAPFHLAEGSVGGVESLVARTGYTGEDGVEVFCAASDTVRLFEALMSAGSDHGLAPCGLGARDTLRLEARLSLYGNEIDETTHPYEAGLGWTVKLGGAEFVGRRRLRAIKAEGWARKLVGFEMTGRGIARSGYPLLDADGHEVGRVTSGSPAPSLGKNIGLGYVPRDFAKIGTPLGVGIRAKVISAVVVKTPFYTRGK